MTDLAIAYWPTGDLIPYARNARTHSEAQVAELAGSIREFGFNNPILVDGERGIIAGHGRLQAAFKLGLATVPVIELSHLSETQKRAYIIADNKLALNAGWDIELLSLELTDLKTVNFNLDLLGFNPDELTSLLSAVEPGTGGTGTDTDTQKSGGAGSLAEKFMIPPFSVLNSREGWWQDRKRAWVGIGLQSELGRGNDNLTQNHPATTATIDFYAQKRALEKQVGHELTKGEAESLMRDAGTLKDHRADSVERMAARDGIDSGEGREKGLTWGTHGLPASEGLNHYRNKKKDLTFNNTEFLSKLKKQKTGVVLDAEDDLAGGSAGEMSGTSIFDPVLCELAYRWFSPPTGMVLDPFAGGSVRGIVAAKLGRDYYGIDLRAEQIAANVTQGKALCEKPPHWVCGDSNDPASYAALTGGADFIFSCPPYADLEVYSDNPLDLSTMDYADFRTSYFSIIKQACERLKQDRFACFVVGEARDKNGAYYNFVGDTIAAFLAAGLSYYNEAILLTMIGSLPVRAAKQFSVSRKLGKTHQNVLVFCKGDPRKATEACGTVEVDEGMFASVEHDQAEDFMPDLTPVEQYGEHFAKREDLWTRQGASGAKSRFMFQQAEGAAGIITAGARYSPQIERAALVAKALGIEARLHTSDGGDTTEIETCRRAGATVIKHAFGRLSVIKARFKRDVVEHPEYLAIPFGCGLEEYADDIARQVINIPDNVKRIVVPCGSGMTLAGVLRGLRKAGRSTAVLGVLVGHEPEEYLTKFAPVDRSNVKLVKSDLAFEKHATTNTWNGIVLDPMYEAKCLPFLQAGDCLWLVGIRESARAPMSKITGVNNDNVQADE